MDIHSGKRPVSAGIGPGKKSNIASRYNANNSNQDAEFCNRVGCNGRLKYNKNTVFGFTGKQKYSRPSSCTSTSKRVLGCSSITSKTTNGDISQHLSQRESSTHHGTDLSQSNTIQCHLDDNGFSSLPTIKQKQAGSQPKIKRATSGSENLSEVGRSNFASQSKSGKVFVHKPASGCVNVVSASSAATASSTVFPVSGTAKRKSSTRIRYGSSNSASDAVSEIIPAAGLKSKSNISRKRVMKDGNTDSENSSSARERRGNSGVKLKDGPVSLSSNGATISSPRQTRNSSSGNDSSCMSARVRRSTISQTRTKSYNRDTAHVSSQAESTGIMSRLPRLDAPTETRVNRRPVESFTSQHIAGRSAGNMPTTMPSTHMEQRASHDLRRVAEILTSLERIGQEAELTYEQLMSLESNLLLGSFHWYDRHRDMRMDIDNMSYEELLALEERMGSVSTALSDDALSESIRRSIYHAPARLGFSSCNENEDVKCSVCQEEFVHGEEMGQLGCDHRYHADCIGQWLRMKNWCPICKASAALSV